MNTNRKNNGWTLCPSKSFPGKFYYFNVLTGEAAWSLESEKNISNNASIHRISDKSHGYPEPAGPPEDNPSTSYAIPHVLNKPEIRRVVNNPFYQPSSYKTSSPIFGQAAFSKYVSNVEPYMSNIIWTPIQLPTPMFISNNKEVKTKIDRDTQTFDQERLVSVHACNTSLSKRFTNYNGIRQNWPKVNIIYDTSTPIKSKTEASNSFQTFTPIFHNDDENRNVITNNLFTREPIFKRVRTKSETDKGTITSPELLLNLDIKQKNTDQYNFGTKTSVREPIIRRIENKMESNKEMNIQKVFETNSLERKRRPNQNCVENVETFDKVTTEAVPKLDSNDLRLLLLAKRRKSIDMGEVQGFVDKEVETRKEDEKTPSMTQKRVTFDLRQQDSSNDSDYENEDDTASQDYDTFPVEQLDLPTDLWYVMVDPDTLVDEYQLIEEYVLSDKNCRLLLPRCLQSEIEAMCIGDCRGRQRVLVARQSARKLAAPLPYIVTLPDIDITNNTEDISDVLKYCSYVMNSGYGVVLVTNSTELYDDAKLLNIQCIKTKEIKSNFTDTASEITYDLKKLKFSIQNESNQENLFLKSPSEFKPYVFEYSEPLPVNSFKTRLFDDFVTKNVSEVKKVDANTSPIGTDTLIDRTHYETKKNQVCERKPLNYEKAASNIGLDIPKLFKNENEPQTHKDNKEKNKPKFEIQKSVNLFESPFKIDTKNDVNENEKYKDDGSNRFQIKNCLMGDTIRDRLDEWICWFSQIMEEALTQFLTRYIKLSDNLTPPWVLYDVVEGIKKLYGSQSKVKSLSNKFTTILLEECFQMGKLKSTMKPSDFMELFECGFLLIQALKAGHPTFPELLDAEKSLNHVLSEIENPSEENFTQNFQTPVLSRSEIVIERAMRQNFIQPSSAIVDYLKKHFEEWKNYEPPLDQECTDRQTMGENVTNDVKIVRTFGRNLKLLNITGNKSMSVNKPTEIVAKENAGNTKEVEKATNLFETTMKDLELSVLHCNTNRSEEKSFKELTKRLSLTNDDKNNEDFYLEPIENSNPLKKDDSKFNKPEDCYNNAVVTQSLDDLNIPKHGNTFDTNENKDGPKVIRNIKPIEAFEEKLVKKSSTMDLDALDYSEIHDTCSVESIMSSTEMEDNIDRKNDSDMSNDDAVSFVYEIKDKKVKNTSRKNDSKINTKPPTSNSNGTNLSNDVSSVKSDIDNSTFKDESTNDSGFDSESAHAHSLIKTFLSELSSSFILIHKFIDKNIKAFKADAIQENEKRFLHAKVNKLFTLVSDIIFKLKGIIERESNDSTALKVMLEKAGRQATTDKRMTRYRQVVTKCLEQALTLENALKLMLNLTGDDCDESVSTCTLDTNIRYFNIFG